MDDTFDKLLKELRTLKIVQESSWKNSIPTEIYDKFFGNYITVSHNIDFEEHRFFKLRFTIIRIFGRLLGIRQIIEDGLLETFNTEHFMEFIEMEEVNTVSYKVKHLH